MKRQWLLGMILLVLVSVAWAATPKTRGATYTVGADVDASGQVVAVATGQDVPATMAPFLSQAARQWRFQPPVIEGKPVTVHTWIVVDLRAVPKPDGNYAISVKFVSNGPKVACGGRSAGGRGPRFVSRWALIEHFRTEVGPC